VWRGANTVFEAMAAMREAIAYADVTRTPLCTLSLDFHAAFDNISHTYLFATFKSYGFSDHFIYRIQKLNENATSSMQINGYISSPLPIRCSVGQGCPLSVQLFANCLNPLLHILENKLPVIWVG